MADLRERYDAMAREFIDWYDDRSGSSGTGFDGVEKRRLVTFALQAGALAAEECGEKCEEQIAEVEADERYHYEPALVQINAPLALIQVEMGGRVRSSETIKDACRALAAELRGES